MNIGKSCEFQIIKNRIEEAVSVICDSRKEKDVDVNKDAFLLFVKDAFMEKIEGIFKRISFADDGYEDIYRFVRNKRYGEIRIVTEDMLPGAKLWDNLVKDWCVFYFVFDSLAYGSQKEGNLILIYLGADDPRFTEAVFGHLCEDRTGQGVETEHDTLWTCPHCHEQTYCAVVNMKTLMEKLHEER